MALFFDAEWFDARLAANGMARSDVAHALGIADEDITLVWKDQRELSAHDVATLASLLGTTAHEIAERAGISTPVPRSIPTDSASLAVALSDIGERLMRLERALADVKALLLDLRNRP
jgi:hypothetical protein